MQNKIAILPIMSKQMGFHIIPQGIHIPTLIKEKKNQQKRTLNTVYNSATPTEMFSCVPTKYPPRFPIQTSFRMVI